MFCSFCWLFWSTFNWFSVGCVVRFWSLRFWTCSWYTGSRGGLLAPSAWFLMPSCSGINDDRWPRYLCECERKLFQRKLRVYRYCVRILTYPTRTECKHYRSWVLHISYYTLTCWFNMFRLFLNNLLHFSDKRERETDEYYDLATTTSKDEPEYSFAVPNLYFIWGTHSNELRIMLKILASLIPLSPPISPLLMKNLPN